MTLHLASLTLTLTLLLQLLLLLLLLDRDLALGILLLLIEQLAKGRRLRRAADLAHLGWSWSWG